MKFTNYFKLAIYKLLKKEHLTSSEAYINWLRNKGIKIGGGVKY